MKRIVVALAVAGLFNATQALAEDSPIVLPSKSTYADEHLARGVVVSSFPSEAPEMIGLSSQWTRADRSDSHAGAVSAFPGSAPEIVTLESRPTRTGSLANDRSKLARSASEPVFSE